MKMEERDGEIGVCEKDSDEEDEAMKSVAVVVADCWSWNCLLMSNMHVGESFISSERI